MYYPKSHITPNLYSNGELSIVGSKTPYYGHYFSTIDKKAFTGRYVGDGSNLELVLYTDVSGETDIDKVFTDTRFEGTDNTTFSKLNNITPNNKLTPSPTPFYPNPTSDDYKLGEFTRYFSKKSNENIYYETSGIYSTPYYIGFSLPWSISGNKEKVYQTNKNLVELREKQLSISGLGDYLKNNYLKFYK